MADDREILDRLNRIERLDGSGAPAAELLAEVRGLLQAAERIARRADDDGLEETLERCRGALAEHDRARERTTQRVAALDHAG